MRQRAVPLLRLEQITVSCSLYGSRPALPLVRLGGASYDRWQRTGQFWLPAPYAVSRAVFSGQCGLCIVGLYKIFLMRPGTLLISKPFLGDPNFERSVVLLCRDEPANGTFGLVLSRLSTLTLSDVLEMPRPAHPAASVPLYLGGPVEPDTLHFLHQLADLPGAQALGQDVFWGGDFDRLLALLGSGAVLAAEVRLFVGYSGWASGQLAAEMQEQSWIRQPASAGKVFTLASDAFWRDILREKGGRYKVLANYPVDPSLN